MRKNTVRSMRTDIDENWIYLMREERPSYKIHGKYLFFNEDMDRLIGIAKKEIENHDFHVAKVSNNLLKGQTEHVLCLYYNDDSRMHELADRNRLEYGVKYRYWKSDAATQRGEYSQEFLSRLTDDERRNFQG